MSAATLLTFAQFEALPEKPGKQELLHGRVIETPPAIYLHQNIVSRLHRLLDRLLEPERAWIDTGYRIGDGWMVPDVSVSWPEQQLEDGRYLLHAPMVAVEVVSPSNSAEDIQEKIEAYLSGGAGEVWIIYPSARLMLVHTKTEVRRFVGNYETRLVPGFALSLADLFL
ncbi:MAG: Uma2 family endonuclease [Bryobacteraceae bacterium]